MKLLDNLKNKCPPSKKTLLSWIRWIKRYCACHSCHLGNCRYYIPGSGELWCTVPSYISDMDLRGLSEDVQPQEPPENVLDILNGVDLDEIIDFQ